MAEHANIERVRRGYEAFAKGDLATLGEVFADDIVWHGGGNNALSGDYKGREEVFAMFGKVAQMTEGTFALELHDVLANDEHGVALVTATGRRGDAAYTGRQAHVFHLRDGKVTEFWGFPEDQITMDKLFA